MLLDHARVAVAEVLGDNEQRRAVHDRVRGEGVPQAMEIGLGLDLAPLQASFIGRA